MGVESDPGGEQRSHQPADGHAAADRGDGFNLSSEHSTGHDSTAPPEGEQQYYAAEWQPDAQEVQAMEEKLQPIQSQLEFLLNKADEYQGHLIHGRDRFRAEGLSQVVPTFLKTCQPLFSYLEHTARSCLPHRPLLPIYIRTRLLQFSQQLCSRLVELILTYASYNFLTLEEANPLSISHIFIGECQVNHLHVSIFRYCKPAPFLSTHQSASFFKLDPSPSNSLFKVMRWNVQRRRMDRDGEEQKRDGRGCADDIEYYFLCFEDMLGEVDEEGKEEEGEKMEEDRNEGQRRGERRKRRDSAGGDEARSCRRIWSIGQWVQTLPNPHTEDLYEWCACGTPQGSYRQFFYLGSTEPSTCSATDCLLGALLAYESQ